MRVCHVVECGGGVGNVIINLVRAGVAAGDDITVIYGAERAWPAFVETLHGLPVKMIPSTMKRSVGLHDAADAMKLYRQLKQNGPFDIIHAHSSKAGALVRLLRFFLPKSVLVYTPHAFMTMAPGSSPIYGWIEWLLSPFCDVIICLSQQEREHAMKQLHIAAYRLVVIPNGIDIHYPANRAEARARLDMQDSNYVIGFVGRFEEQKNPLLAIETFAAVAARHTHARLVMIGYGALEGAARQSIADKKLQARVTIMQDLNARNLIAGFDCLLCSSAYEGFSLIILEALAAGVSVVSTPVSGASEAIITGKTGTVTGDFTAPPLAAGIDSLIGEDAGTRAQTSQQCLAQAKNFSVEKIFAQTRDIYFKLMATA